MKVEFAIEECWSMMDTIVESLAGLDLSKKDRAALRRWRSDEMTPGSPAMRLLAEKLNTELQRAAARNEVSPIKKPDWAN